MSSVDEAQHFILLVQYIPLFNFIIQRWLCTTFVARENLTVVVGVEPDKLLLSESPPLKLRPVFFSPWQTGMWCAVV